MGEYQGNRPLTTRDLLLQNTKETRDLVNYVKNNAADIRELQSRVDGIDTRIFRSNGGPSILDRLSRLEEAIKKQGSASEATIVGYYTYKSALIPAIIILLSTVMAGVGSIFSRWMGW